MFLEDLKRDLERTRRFTPELSGGPTPYTRAVCTTEATIEEWLITNGYWISDDDF